MRVESGGASQMITGGARGHRPGDGRLMAPSAAPCRRRRPELDGAQGCCRRVVATHGALVARSRVRGRRGCLSPTRSSIEDMLRATVLEKIYGGVDVLIGVAASRRARRHRDDLATGSANTPCWRAVLPRLREVFRVLLKQGRGGSSCLSASNERPWSRGERWRLPRRPRRIAPTRALSGRGRGPHGIRVNTRPPRPP